MLVSVDLGKHKSALAWYEYNELVNTSYGDNGTLRKLLITTPVDDIVFEWPQVYRNPKGDPNDLLYLALAAGRMYDYGRPHLIVPRTWKGQQPKEAHHEKILKALLEKELIIYKRGSKNEHVRDAIGLGLWYLGRL